VKPREPDLLWLAHALGSSHEEIAASLGLKTGSIKALLFRARRRLASLLRQGTRRPQKGRLVKTGECHREPDVLDAGVSGVTPSKRLFKPRRNAGALNVWSVSNRGVGAPVRRCLKKAGISARSGNGALPRVDPRLRAPRPV
jgi:hypothetical protein